MGFSLPSPMVIASIMLTAACWGIYGPVLHWGQAEMGHSRMRAFLCVGMAYFVIAVIVPVVLLKTNPEKGQFSTMGIVWSSLAGAAGALGALGIIMAFNYGGRPVYVMPLVFGCAPVINSFWTIYWQNTWKDISPMFLAGLILVGAGAVTVLFFAPPPPKPAGAKADAHAKDDAGKTEAHDDHGAAEQAEKGESKEESK